VDDEPRHLARRRRYDPRARELQLRLVERCPVGVDAGTVERCPVELDAFPGRKLEAKVESLSGGTGARFSLLPADNASGNFVKAVQRISVRLALVDPPADVHLRAGFSADVTVYVK